MLYRARSSGSEQRLPNYGRSASVFCEPCGPIQLHAEATSTNQHFNDTINGKSSTICQVFQNTTTWFSRCNIFYTVLLQVVFTFIEVPLLVNLLMLFYQKDF